MPLPHCGNSKKDGVFCWVLHVLTRLTVPNRLSKGRMKRLDYLNQAFCAFWADPPFAQHKKPFNEHASPDTRRTRSVEDTGFFTCPFCRLYP